MHRSPALDQAVSNNPPIRIRYENAQGAWREFVMHNGTHYTFVAKGGAVELVPINWNFVPAPGNGNLGGRFQRRGDFWDEFQGAQVKYTFREVQANPDQTLLFDESRNFWVLLGQDASMLRAGNGPWQTLYRRTN